MIQIKACIFDLDGVIVDSAKYHFIAWQSLAHSQGVSFEKEDNEQLKGVGRMESLDFLLKKGKLTKTKSEKEQLAKTKNDHYLRLIEKMDQSEILPGIDSFLNALAQENIKIGLGSSSKNAQPILKKIGLFEKFEVIIDGTKTTRSKPDPQVFELGAKEFNLNPNECLVFEDAVKGVEAALNGGFKCIGIGEWENLVQADYVIPGFKNFTLNELASIY